MNNKYWNKSIINSCAPSWGMLFGLVSVAWPVWLGAWTHLYQFGKDLWVSYILNVTNTYVFIGTKCYFSAFAAYLRQVHNIRMPPNRYWDCAIANTTILSSLLSSTLLIIAMTLERCYSIVKPHKAASFNTTQKAKISIACVCIFSSLYNIPNVFFSNYQSTRCIVNKSSIPNVQIYAWLSFRIILLYLLFYF